MGSLLPRAAIASLAVALMAGGAFAQGIADQQNDPTGGNGFGCGSPPILNGSVCQGFVPSADNLVAVELRLMAGSAFPSGGTTTTARIRDGSSSGTVLGTASASVAGPLSANTQILVRFDFTQMSLTAGNTYLIEWVTPPTTELMWVGQTGDPYPAGTAYSCSGNPWPVSGTDFNFITYAAAPEPTTSSTDADPACGSLLEKLRDQVDELGLTNRYKRCSTERLLDAVEKHLAKGKTKAAGANVLALECQMRVLAKFGVISDDQAAAIIDTAEAFRECIGANQASRHHDWHWGKDRHH